MKYRRDIRPIQLGTSFQDFDKGKVVTEYISAKLNPQEDDILDWEAGCSFSGTAQIVQVGAELNGIVSIKIKKLS